MLISIMVRLYIWEVYNRQFYFVMFCLFLYDFCYRNLKVQSQGHGHSPHSAPVTTVPICINTAVPPTISVYPPFHICHNASNGWGGSVLGLRLPLLVLAAAGSLLGGAGERSGYCKGTTVSCWTGLGLLLARSEWRLCLPCVSCVPVSMSLSILLARTGPRS